MANKTFQGRIVQKHDTEANWKKATNFVPLKGEIIIYDDLKKIKIGDGTTKVGSLAFINDLDALAKVATSGSYNDLKDKPTIPTVPATEITANTKARHTHNNKDVLDNITGIVDMDHINNPVNQSDLVPYEVFQAASQMILDEIPTNLATVATSGLYKDLLQKPTIGDGEVSISYRNSSGGTTSSRFTLNDTKAHTINIYTPTKLSEFTNDTNYTTQDELTNATAGLTGAMHFIGTSTTSITDHGTQSPTINGVVISTKTAGDTVIYNHLEFVWDGTKWEKLGDEGSYVLKTQKINGKVLSGDVNLTADDVNALPITGGTLTGDVNMSNNRIDNTKSLSFSDILDEGIEPVFSYALCNTGRLAAAGVQPEGEYTIVFDTWTHDDPDAIIEHLSSEGWSMPVITLRNIANPSESYDAANKSYVDGQIVANKSSTTIITWADNGT